MRGNASLRPQAAYRPMYPQPIQMEKQLRYRLEALAPDGKCPHWWRRRHSKHWLDRCLQHHSRNKQQRKQKLQQIFSTNSRNYTRSRRIAVSQHRPQQKPTSVQTTSKVMPLAATMRLGNAYSLLACNSTAGSERMQPSYPSY